MGVIGGFAKALLVLTIVYWIFSIFVLIFIKQTALALILLIGFIIPLCMVGYPYLKNLKKE